MPGNDPPSQRVAPSLTPWRPMGVSLKPLSINRSLFPPRKRALLAYSRQQAACCHGLLDPRSKTEPAPTITTITTITVFAASCDFLLEPIPTHKLLLRLAVTSSRCQLQQRPVAHSECGWSSTVWSKAGGKMTWANQGVVVRCRCGYEKR